MERNCANYGLKVQLEVEDDTVVDILVENMGRVNYAEFNSPILNDQRKGDDDDDDDEEEEEEEEEGDDGHVTMTCSSVAHCLEYYDGISMICEMAMIM